MTPTPTRRSGPGGGRSGNAHTNATEPEGSAPYIVSWRRARRLPELAYDRARLERAVRVEMAAPLDVANALAHLTLAARATCGTEAVAWARERLRAEVDALDVLDDDELEHRADELEREYEKYEQRARAKVAA